jgi:excisionase family DNA binding protein
MEGWLTLKQAAERAGVTPSRMRQLVLKKRFPGAIKPGHDWLIPEADLVRYMQEDRDRRYRDNRRPEPTSRQ